MTEEEAYEQLVIDVTKISVEGGAYLATKAKELPDFIPCGSLTTALIWAYTPQGDKFWSKIYATLETYKHESY